MTVADPAAACSERGADRNESAEAATAKISIAALEETLGQGPAAGLVQDHFTLKIMYFSMGSPSREGKKRRLAFMVSIPLDLFVHSQAGTSLSV